MKKFLVYVLTIAIACSLVLSLGITTASAAASVGFSVQVSPEMLSASGGSVLLEANVNVQGDSISSATITYPDGSTVQLSGGGQIAPGDYPRIHVNQDFKIPAESMDKDLTFKLTYTSVSDGAQGSQTDIIRVYKKAGTIKITGSASVDNKNLKQGEKATFTFTFKNEGDVKIENASLKAPPIDGGDVIGQPFSLNPGDTKKMEYRITVNKTMEVKPTLTFTAEGSNKTLALNSMNVTVEEALTSGIGLSLKADKDTINAGESVVLTANIANTGNDKLTGLKLADNQGNPVELKDSTLEKGASTTATVTITPQATGNYKYTVTAKNSAGDSVSAESNQVTITIGSASASPSASEEPVPQTLAIRVDADSYALDSPGEVTFQVTVTNNSDVLLNNVQVTEKTIGDIGTTSAMGRDSKTFTAKTEVKETSEFVFTVTATTADGQTVTAVTEPLPITVKGGAGLGLGFWGILLLIIIIAIAAIGLVLFMLYRKNKKVGGASLFGGGASQAPRQNPYGARRKPSAFNNTITRHDEGSRDAQPRAVRKPVSPPPRTPARKNNTKFGDRNKF